MQLAINCNTLPDRVELNNVEQISAPADYGGDFTGVGKGRLLDGQVVALKRISYLDDATTLLEDEIYPKKKVCTYTYFRKLKSNSA